MTIIDALKNKNSKVEVSIEQKLYTLADDLEKKARKHLDRITTILTEFDIHNEKHSEKVIQNIEQLLGNKTIAKLSSYELFLLHLAAFFHDCAMAPSDWEISVMKLTEGTELYFSNKDSIKHDLKPPLKQIDAIELITERKNDTYKQFDGEVKEWIFSPAKENDLIKYLSALIIDYQIYRNGFADQIKKIEDNDKFNELNEFIRTDYIRATHHLRIEEYIKNLENYFSERFEQKAWGIKLSQDLSKICRSHGEDISFINDFETNSQYYGPESANLQFVAILLRLGDVIHYSFDRAPVELRTAKFFKSEYSFNEWAIKNNGVNYTINLGKITYRAYCDKPETYFKLHKYIDWIDNEIQNCYRFQMQWDEKYKFKLYNKVDRDNITNDTHNFEPVRGLSFTLNQKKIIELLMGVGLYKDKFACLRELYQNSLDACRCMLSQENLSQRNTKGLIEFSLETYENKTYLCCLDNGIGMTREIIERFLLKIGNSYYKSSDFYKQQAAWGGKFTPTSQFGIGILSCFMIGDKIEITTKVFDKDYVSCSIDGPHESFYYKKATELDKEKIPYSGTLIKILLSDNTKNNLHSREIEKLGLILYAEIHDYPDEDSEYDNLKEYGKYFEIWEDNLYAKINRFIGRVPDNVEVSILSDKKNSFKILSKPIPLDDTVLKISPKDYYFIDYLNNLDDDSKYNYKNVKDIFENHIINISYKSVEYIKTISLPKKKILNNYVYMPTIGQNGIYIDGIDILNADAAYNYYTYSLSRFGLINYTGEERPQISVDRTSLVEPSKNNNEVINELIILYFKSVISTVLKHIKSYKLGPEAANYTLERALKDFDFAYFIFINELSLTEYANFKWLELNKLINKNYTISDFSSCLEFDIINYNLSGLNSFTRKILFSKFVSAKHIAINNNNVNIKSDGFIKTDARVVDAFNRSRNFLICADEWNNSYYDIISNLYPFTHKKFFDLYYVDKEMIINSRVKETGHSFDYDGLLSLYSQSPFTINTELGLYSKEYYSENSLYEFQKKKPNINLSNILTDKNSSYMIAVYVAPVELTVSQKNKLLEITDNSYLNGIKEGWSLLITGMEKENIIILPGKPSREELVAKISDEFWKKYNNVTFKFTDGSIVKNPIKLKTKTTKNKAAKAK